MSSLFNNPTSVHTTAIVFLLIGAALLALSAWYFVRRRAFLQESASATGTVVDLNVIRSESTDDDNRVTVDYFSHPRVTYRDANGREMTFASSVGSSPPKYKVGDKVSVRYHPQRPTEAEIDSFWEIWLPTVAFGACGSVCFVIGAAVVALGK